MVWDTIHRERHRAPAEEWGGIAYALAALDATLPDDWEIVPLIKVGSDLAGPANEFLRDLARRGSARFIEVAQPNNRVTLRYTGPDRRTEQLRGGVPPWDWTELGPLVRDLDAIYCNMISGFELDLETAVRLRRGYAGPMYADLHSLFLGIERDGTRVRRPLPRVAEWFACFDVVQLNQEELALIAAEPMDVAAMAFARGVRLLVVTLGPRGAAYFLEGPFGFLGPRAAAPGPIRTAIVPAPEVPDVRDPTGCGDVFGATLAAQLLRGAPIEDAIRAANTLAARNAQYCGATALHHHLRGEILSR
jgi:sugar/nucleoside kinase (ribokinase family)